MVLATADKTMTLIFECVDYKGQKKLNAVQKKVLRTAYTLHYSTVNNEYSRSKIVLQ